MQRLRNPLFLSAVLGLSLSTYSYAGTDSGLYIGGSLGSATVDFSESGDPTLDGFDNISVDDSDTAYKIFVGYNIGIIPLLDLAVEGGYVNFGTQTGLISGGILPSTKIDTEVDGWNAFGLVGIDLGPFGIFGKAGFLSWDGDISNLDDSGTDPAYGIGAKFQLGSFQLRAEYELYDLEFSNIDYYSLGGAFVF